MNTFYSKIITFEKLFCQIHLQCFDENITNLYGNDQKIGRIFGLISGYFQYPVSYQIRDFKKA
jgi:hypothetical protein